MLAKERLCPALALYLEVLDISEGSDRWNGDGLLQGCHVNIMPIFNHQLCIRRKAQALVDEAQRFLDMLPARLLRHRLPSNWWSTP